MREYNFPCQKLEPRVSGLQEIDSAKRNAIARKAFGDFVRCGEAVWGQLKANQWPREAAGDQVENVSAPAGTELYDRLSFGCKFFNDRGHARTSLAKVQV